MVSLLFLLKFILSIYDRSFIVGYLRRCLRAHDWLNPVLSTKLWLIHTVAIIVNSLKRLGRSAHTIFIFSAYDCVEGLSFIDIECFART